MRADVRGVPYSEIEKPKSKAADDPLKSTYTQGLDNLQRVMVRVNLSCWALYWPLIMHLFVYFFIALHSWWYV